MYLEWLNMVQYFYCIIALGSIAATLVFIYILYMLMKKYTPYVFDDCAPLWVFGKAVWRILVYKFKNFGPPEK